MAKHEYSRHLIEANNGENLAAKVSPSQCTAVGGETVAHIKIVVDLVLCCHKEPDLAGNHYHLYDNKQDGEEE